MVELSLPNLITVGLISIAAFAVFKWGTNAVGIDTSWL